MDVRLQYYTFLNGGRKISVAAENVDNAWIMAFELAPNPDVLTKLDFYSTEDFTPEVIFAGSTVH